MGLSITAPHKEHALQWLRAAGPDGRPRGTVEPLAARCGAINTLTRGTGGWVGANTDCDGIRAAIRASAEARGLPVTGHTACVLGAGGAARAAVVALQDLGAAVTVCNRTAPRAAALARDLGCASAPWERRTEHVAGAIVINCTTVGMAPQENETPLDRAALAGCALLFDTVYVPRDTRLLREARAAQCATIEGLELFLAQAAAQMRRWYGAAPTADRLRPLLAEP